jgi:hypothetical protein
LLFIKWFNLSSFANKTHEIKLNQGALQEHTESNKKSNKFNEEIPRKMIPEAAFREFSAKTLGKLAVFGRNLPENARNSSQESDSRIRLSVLTGTCRFRMEPDKSGHRNTTEPTVSMPDCSTWI